MNAKRMLSMFCLLLAFLGTVPVALAQSPKVTATTASSEPDVLPGLPRPPDTPASLMQSLTSKPYSCEELIGPYFERDPLLDPACLPPPGWFVDLDLALVVPHFKNHLNDLVTVGARPTDLVHVPGAELDWTVAPRFELGYGLPSGFGEFVLSYRFLVTQGSETVAGVDAPAALKSRLDLNVADFSYASREFSLWPRWDMKWRFGLRFVDFFYDSSAAESFAAAAAGSGIFASSESNQYWGIGPSYGLELSRRFDEQRLALVARADGSTFIGNMHQQFSEASTMLSSGVPLTGTTSRNNDQAVPTIDLFLGLGWQPNRCTRLSLGYVYEYWWNIGRLSNFISRGELSDQGIVARAEFRW
jgi:hypothetical protein